MFIIINMQKYIRSDLLMNSIFHILNRGPKILKFSNFCHASGANVVGESSKHWKSAQ